MTGPGRFAPSSLGEIVGTPGPENGRATLNMRRGWACLATSLAGHALLLALIASLEIAQKPLATDVVLMVETVSLVHGDPQAGEAPPGAQATSSTMLPMQSPHTETPTGAQPANGPQESPARPRPPAKQTPPAELAPARKPPARRAPEKIAAQTPVAEPTRQADNSGPVSASPETVMRPGRNAARTEEDGPDTEQKRGAASATGLEQRRGQGQGQAQAQGKGPDRYEGEFGAGEGPRFVKRVMPVYPPQARRLGSQGVVVLRLAIDAAGALTHVEVAQSAGELFDAEAMRAVKASSYRPATRGGHPVPCLAVIRIRFSLTS